MNPTDPTPLPCPFCGVAAKTIDGTDYVHHPKGDCPLAGNAYLPKYWNTRAPSAELAQAQAEAAAMREWVQESVVVSMEFADGRVLTKADLLATTAGAELLERLRKAEALAAQMSAEREHNAMEALAMRAERDEARAEASNVRANLANADEKIEELQSYIRGHQLADAAGIITERDAANALVAAIKREADKLHGECIRDGETDVYCLTSEQIEALAKHFLPTTTENTKPQ